LKRCGAKPFRVDCSDARARMKDGQLSYNPDRVQAHVISNRRFSQKPEDLGEVHEAEEYHGDPR